MKSNNNFCEFFNEVDKKLPVDKWEFCGIHLWPILKWEIFKRNVKRENSSNIKQFFGYFRIILGLLKDWKNNDFDFTKKDIVFFGNGASKSLFEHKWFDYLIEPIKDNYEAKGKKTFFFESGNKERFPRNTPTLYIRPLEVMIYILAFIIAKFTRYNYKPEKWSLFVKLAKAHKLIYGKEDLKKLQHKVLCIVWLSRFYVLILKKLSPEKLYLVCYYSISGFAVVIACKKLKIEVIDIQHGSNMSHFSYIGWNKVPKYGYNTIPDIFWNWSRFDLKELKLNNSKKFLKVHVPFLGGLPWIDFWKSNNVKVKKYNSIIKNACKSYTYKILVILRPDYFDESNKWNMLCEVIKETSSEILWLIRKHPAYDSNEKSLTGILNLVKSNVNIELASSLPLYAILKNVDLVITTSSNATAQEAYFFGVKTIFISKAVKDEAGELIKKMKSKIILDKISLIRYLRAKLI